MIQSQSLPSVTTLGSNSSSSNLRQPRSILKSDDAVHHSHSIGSNLNLDGECPPTKTTDTVLTLQMLFMSDFFSGDDQANSGLPGADDSHPDTSLFKDDMAHAAVKTDVVAHDVNMESKEEREGDEGEDIDQPPANNSYKFQRKLSPSSSMKKYVSERLSGQVVSDSFMTTPSTGTFRDTAKRHVRTLSKSTTETNTKKNDSWGRLNQASKNNSPRNNGNNVSERLSGQVVSDSFITTPSTGTFRDTTKRHVRTLSKSPTETNTKKNDSWGKLNQATKKNSPSNNGNTPQLTSISSMLKTMELVPSTGTFRDTTKRHVRLRAKTSKNDSWSKLNQASKKNSRNNNGTAVSIMFNSMDLVPSIPSTGTFRDTAKRHVVRIAAPNQEWGIELQNGRNPLTGFNIRRPNQANQEWGDTAAPTPDVPEAQGQVESGNQVRMLQHIMESKADCKELQQQPEAPKATGLLVNWGDHVEGDQDSGFLDNDDKQQKVEHENIILIVKDNPALRQLSDITTEDFNDDDIANPDPSSRRISDITMGDDFDDDLSLGLGLDQSSTERSSFEGTLHSIPEEPEELFHHINVGEEKDEEDGEDSIPEELAWTKDNCEEEKDGKEEKIEGGEEKEGGDDEEEGQHQEVPAKL